MQLQNDEINIKKRFTCEYGLRLKVLSIYAIKDEAQEIDKELCQIQSPRHHYLSCCTAAPEERLTAIHYNDAKNAKSRCETLHRMKLKDKVQNAENNKHATLE